MAPKLKSEKKEFAVYVIAGKEPSMLDLEAENLLGQLLKPEERLTSLLSTSGSRAVITDILDELRILPFLAQKRVVIVKDADKFVSDNRSLLEDYFDNPCITGVLVLTVSTWPASTKLAKKLSPEGKLINVTSPKAWQLPARLVGYAADAHKKKIGKDAAELVVELTGDNLARLYGEIDKLAIYVGSKDSISICDVESLIGHNRFFSAFEVIDCCLTGQVEKAVGRLRDMFAKDREAEYTVIGAFAYHIRRMFNAKVMLEKGQRTDAIAQQINIRSHKEQFFSQVRSLSLHRIGSLIEKLANIDYAVKTGRAKVQEEMEDLVLRLASVK